MKILVTGANGYLGQGIVKKLVEHGHGVIATDYEINRIDERSKRIEGDVFSIDNPYSFFGKPDVLLHLAWKDGFMHSSLYHITDLPKHYIFLRKMAESGIKKICIMGSMHEVGFYEGSINEYTPCNPMSLYGIGKNSLRRSMELMLLEHDNLILQWYRGYYIVGNSEYGNSIFSKIVLAAKNGEKSFPFTKGENQFDFIDYDVFCHQVVCAIEQDDINGIINICSGKPEKISDRVERFIKENELNIKLEYGAFPDRIYDSKAVWGDDTKILKIMRDAYL